MRFSEGFVEDGGGAVRGIGLLESSEDGGVGCFVFGTRCGGSCFAVAVGVGLAVVVVGGRERVRGGG